MTKRLGIKADETVIPPQRLPSALLFLKQDPQEDVLNDFPTAPQPAAWAAVMRVIIPGPQTGSAALKHLQFVSNFSPEANHCAEQNLCRHKDSESLIAIMLKILNFKKKGKESKFILLEQQGPAASPPLTSHLQLLKKPCKQVDRVLRSTEERMRRKLPFFLSNCRKSKFLRKSEVLAQQHHWRALLKSSQGRGHQRSGFHLQQPQQRALCSDTLPPIKPGLLSGKLTRTHICGRSYLNGRPLPGSLVTVNVGTGSLGPQLHCLLCLSVKLNYDLGIHCFSFRTTGTNNSKSGFFFQSQGTKVKVLILTRSVARLWTPKPLPS